MEDHHGGLSKDPSRQVDGETPGSQWMQDALGWSCWRASSYRARHFLPLPPRDGAKGWARKRPRGGLLEVHHNPMGSTCLLHPTGPIRRNEGVQANLPGPQPPGGRWTPRQGGPPATSSTCRDTTAPSTARPPHSSQARQSYPIPSPGQHGRSPEGPSQRVPWQQLQQGCKPSPGDRLTQGNRRPPPTPTGGHLRESHQQRA